MLKVILGLSVPCLASGAVDRYSGDDFWSICKWVGKAWPVCFIYSTSASCCRETQTLGKPKHSFPWKNQKHQPLASSWCPHWSRARQVSVPAAHSSPAKRPLLPQQSCQWPEVLSTTPGAQTPCQFHLSWGIQHQQCSSSAPATCQPPAVLTWVSTVYMPTSSPEPKLSPGCYNILWWQPVAGMFAQLRGILLTVKCCEYWALPSQIPSLVKMMLYITGKVTMTYNKTTMNNGVTLDLTSAFPRITAGPKRSSQSVQLMCW